MLLTALAALCTGILMPVKALGSVRQLYQFSNSTFHDIENIAIRPNGQLLLTAITEPVTYILDPSSQSPTATILHTFDHATGLAGITQVTPDVFAVVVGNYSVQEFKGILGSFSIWLIDMTLATPKFEKVVDIPEAQTPNGLTTISSNIVMAADSATGIVYSINIKLRTYENAIQNAKFLPSAQFPLGINGIHSRGQMLYFTNSALGLYGRIPVTPQGTAAGSLSIIASAPPGNFYDDFSFDLLGNAYITTHPSSIERVTASGFQSAIANSSSIIQPTACVFGNAPRTKCTLYVVTAGGVDGSQITSGQVLAITAC